MDNKELIWVDKDMAEEYKKLSSDIEKSRFVNKIMADRKLDITSDIENLDDDLLRFKSFVLKYSTEFKKAYDEQAEKIDKLWEECNEPVRKVDAQTMQIKEKIKSISNELKNVSHELSNLDTYKLEKVINLINTYSNMSEKDKEIFKIILDKQ